jgi:hypothetical protein
MAGGQIRHALTEAREAGVSDATVEACLRALPAIERKIESLCPAIIGGTKHGFAAAYGPVLENPQAMILLCVLANSRGDCLAASVIVTGPFEYSEEEWAQNMAWRDTRAAAWHEVDEAIQRKDARTAMACVTVLIGPSGWDKLMAAVQHIADLGSQPVLWVTVGSFGKKAGGALGVVALPQAINTVLQGGGVMMSGPKTTRTIIAALSGWYVAALIEGGEHEGGRWDTPDGKYDIPGETVVDTEATARE